MDVIVGTTVPTGLFFQVAREGNFCPSSQYRAADATKHATQLKSKCSQKFHFNLSGGLAFLFLMFREQDDPLSAASLGCLVALYCQMSMVEVSLWLSLGIHGSVLITSSGSAAPMACMKEHKVRTRGMCEELVVDIGHV